MPGVEAVTEDSSVRLQGAGLGPTGENGDMTNVAKLTGATTFWRNGYTGQGVDVALLDSGVLPVEGLMTPNKLVIGPDLSFESQVNNLRNLDTYGHGTHMAGIIAGRDQGATCPALDDNSKFRGMAPARASSASSWPTPRATPTSRRSWRPSTGSSATRRTTA